MAENLRPRFRYYVTSSPEELRDHFKAQFSDPKIPYTGTSIKYHIVIDYPEAKRHYWSPQLDLNIEVYDKGTLIRGLIGPRPSVWSVFMFFNTIAGLAGLGGLTIGASQWSMETSPVAFWLVPVSAIIFAAVFFIGKQGKHIAHDESVTLFNYLMANLQNPIELELDDL